VEFDSLEQEFTIMGPLRCQVREMPRDVLEAHYLLTFKALLEQKRITDEVRDHLEQLRKVLHALG
jgi:hypothetical protein